LVDSEPVISLKLLTNAHFGAFILDGDGLIPTAVGIVGISMDRSVNCTLTDLKPREFASSDLVSSGSVNCTIDRLITTRTQSLVLGVSHGLDIDADTAAQPTQNLTINDSILDGSYQEATKFEHCTGVIYNRCTFNGQVTYGDPLTFDDAEATLNDCTLNGRLYIDRRSVNYALTLNNPIFTEAGGVIQIKDDTNSAVVINNPVYNGRNTIYGHNGTTWQSVSNYIETNPTYNNAPAIAGKTMFASHVDTGSSYYGNANAVPYTTPNTAKNNYEALIEDVNLDEANMHYAFLSDFGAQPLLGFSTPTPSAAGIYHLEGYPNKTEIAMSGFTADFVSGNYNEGSTVRKFTFDGTGIGIGGQCIRPTGTSVLDVDDITAKNFTATVAGMLFETRDTSVINATNITLGDCVGNGVQDGYMIKANAGSTLNLSRFKIKNCTESATLRACRWAAGTFGEIHSGLCKDNGRVFIIQDADVKLNNVIFENNTQDVYTATIILTNPITNCASEDEAKLDIATTEVNYSVVVGGYTGSGGTGIVTTAQTYIDAANDDYELAIDSSGISSGSGAWFNGKPNPQGFNGEPYSNFDTDIGYMQTTHGLFHPVNLRK
jgi:hypothetical protein